ncbi:alpha/beta hydrolase [Candidatus Stoquefichus massiliensis]|uniref:alpha/beta hydrolase n=1 Tax=Candidatus Stoquefichus massiliensis TaxID=1470350 RepID=UPI0004840C10|nr:alpha/beta fold hydrolase [Candidatus Stoquefichus massiliensis]
MFVSFRFDMEKLKRDRKITVYLPDDYYDQEKRYPVLYIQDGQNAFFDRLSFCGVSWGFLDYVQMMHLDVIMVAIPCNFTGFKRMDEYGPWLINSELSYQETQIKDKIIGGEGKAYVEWMIEELKPYIDRRFRTIADDTAIVGSSMGGVISAYAALNYPEVFRKCASLSTAFWFYMNEFEDVIENHEYSIDNRFYFDLGEFEGCGDDVIDEWYIESNNRIYCLLKDKMKNLEYHYFEGAKHNEGEWRERVPMFMEFLYK